MGVGVRRPTRAHGQRRRVEGKKDPLYPSGVSHPVRWWWGGGGKYFPCRRKRSRMKEEEGASRWSGPHPNKIIVPAPSEVPLRVVLLQSPVVNGVQSAPRRALRRCPPHGHQTHRKRPLEWLLVDSHHHLLFFLFFLVVVVGVAFLFFFVFFFALPLLRSWSSSPWPLWRFPQRGRARRRRRRSMGYEKPVVPSRLGPPPPRCSDAFLPPLVRFPRPRRRRSERQGGGPEMPPRHLPDSFATHARWRLMPLVW